MFWSALKGRNKTNWIQIKQIDLGNLFGFVRFNFVEGFAVLAKRLKQAERLLACKSQTISNNQTTNIHRSDIN